MKSQIKILSHINPKSSILNDMTEGFIHNLAFIETIKDLKKNKKFKAFDDRIRKHKKTTLEIAGRLNNKENRCSFVDNTQFFEFKEDDWGSSWVSSLFISI